MNNLWSTSSFFVPKNRKAGSEESAIRSILIMSSKKTIKIIPNLMNLINFMWFLAGQKASDYSTIARFRSGYLEIAYKDLFYQMVRRLADLGEHSKETVFIDGAKIEARSSLK